MSQPTVTIKESNKENTNMYEKLFLHETDQQSKEIQHTTNQALAASAS